MSVQEYTINFLEKARFARVHDATMEKMIRRFISELCNENKSAMANPKTFEEAVEQALMSENDYKR